MTYLIRPKTPLVKNITYFFINLIDAYTTTTLKGAILKAMRFLLIEFLSVNFFRDFLTTVQVSESQKSISTAVHALFGDVSSHLSHFYLSS